MVFIALYYMFVMPQSAKWLYTWLRFQESREVLQYIAKYNMTDDEVQEEFKTLKFDAEGHHHCLDRAECASQNDYVMSDLHYYTNMAVMCILWSVVCYSYYLMQYLTKYYEGNIFLNYYLDGCAGIIGVLLAYPIYMGLKMKYSFTLSLSFTLFFILLLFLHQENYISASWISFMMTPTTP